MIKKINKNGLILIILLFIIGITTFMLFHERDKSLTVLIDKNEYILLNGISMVDTVPNSCSLTLTRLTPFHIYNDINNDGKKDLISIITQDTGGSGTFYYLSISLKTASGFTSLESQFIGDRIIIDKLNIKNNNIFVEYFDRSLNTPFSEKPDISKVKIFTVQKKNLVVVEK